MDVQEQKGLVVVLVCWANSEGNLAELGRGLRRSLSHRSGFAAVQGQPRARAGAHPLECALGQALSCTGYS